MNTKSTAFKGILALVVLGLAVCWVWWRTSTAHPGEEPVHDNSEYGKFLDTAREKQNELRQKLTEIKASAPAPTSQTPAPRTATLSDEAFAQAHAVFTKKYQKCGDSWFSQCRNEHYFRGPVTSIYQVKGVRWRTDVVPLSEADKLNGLEWKGSIQYSAEVSRWFYDFTPRGGKGWDTWKDGGGIERYNVVKKNGTWAVVNPNPDSGGMTFIPVECDKIPDQRKIEEEERQRQARLAESRTKYLEWFQSYFAPGKEHSGRFVPGFRTAEYPFTLKILAAPEPVAEGRGDHQFEMRGNVHWRAKAPDHVSNAKAVQDHPVLMRVYFRTPPDGPRSVILSFFWWHSRENGYFSDGSHTATCEEFTWRKDGRIVIGD